MLRFPGEHHSVFALAALKGHSSQNQTGFFSFHASLSGEINSHPK